MENLAYIGLSQQVALKQQMDITASNIANMSTSGYKSQQVMFTDFISSPKKGEEINQAFNHNTYRDLSAGSFQQTFNQLDLAISGEGYFVVQSPSGGLSYTRDGGFMLDTNRQIVTKSGNPVFGEGDKPIVVPQEAGNITITPDGNVSSKDGVIARLRTTTFEDEQQLTRIGDNLYTAENTAEKQLTSVNVVQGSLEASNVNPVVEMTRMTEIMRSFQTAQNMQQNDHDRQRKMIQSLTRTA